MSPQDIFLETAHRIGERLVGQALWEGEACTWAIQKPEAQADGEYEAVPDLAQGGLYQGTAGIALFLATLYKETQTPSLRRTAAGALRHALADATIWSTNSFGFHSGRVGVAYTAARLGLLLDHPEYLEEARALLHPLIGQADREYGIDVIGGAAGAIPALLHLAEALDHDAMTTLAIQLGDGLIARAQREPEGWSWGTMRPGSVRNLLGFAHGAAGIGLALYELYAATGQDHYLYAGEQALLYENQFFSEAAGNWPDLRHDGLATLLHTGELETLKAFIRAGGEISPYTPRHMSAWCHGAPGIGLARLRAYELFHLDHHKADAALALQTTEVSLDHESNYSLCHGLGGNAETLLVGAEVLGDVRLRERAEACGLQGWETYEQAGQPWPCGTLGDIPDPSLLLGEAGIGYFYLRLYAAETPSVLLLRGAAHATPAVDNTWGALHRAYVNGYFGRTLRIIEALNENGRPAFATATPLRLPFDAAPPLQVYQDVTRYIETAPQQHRAALSDAFLPERTRFEIALALDNFSEEFLEGLRQPALHDIAWATTTLHLAPDTRIVESQWDWDAWLALGEPQALLPPEASPVFYILYRKDNRIHLRRVNRFSAAVLQQLERPASLDQVATGLLEALGHTEALDMNNLQQMIVAQLREAYQARFIRCLQEQAMTLPA